MGGGPGSLNRFVFCAIGTLCSSGATEQLHSKPKQSDAHIRRRQVFLYTNFHPLKSFHLGFIFLMRPYQKTTDWRFQEYRISKRTAQINTVPIDIINRVSRIQQSRPNRVCPNSHFSSILYKYKQSNDSIATQNLQIFERNFLFIF